MTQALKNLKNLINFNGLILTKVIMFDQRKYRGVMFDCTQDWYKIWRKTGLCFKKLTLGMWQIFTRALESLQIGALMASFCLKLKMYEAKIYRGVMCHDNEEWCKNWRGIDLSVQNWHEEFDKFWPEHSKISKICTLIGCFWPKQIMFELKKSIGKLFLMPLNIDATFQGKLSCAFKNDMRNLANFHQSTFESLKIVTLMASFYAKWKMCELKIYRGVLCNDNKEWCKIWREIDL